MKLHKNYFNTTFREMPRGSASNLEAEPLYWKPNFFSFLPKFNTPATLSLSTLL